MQPLELLFPGIPHNYGYQFSVVTDYGDGFSAPTDQRVEWGELTWLGGYCDGYRHVLTAWEVLTKRPVIAGRGKDAEGNEHDIVIAFEITNRIGPMITWSAARVAKLEPKVRTLGLRTHEQYVEILDLAKLICRRTGVITCEGSYLKVQAHAWWDVVHYIETVAERSRILANALAFIRRRRGGIKLVTAELIAPWQLAEDVVEPLALAATIYAIVNMEHAETILERLRNAQEPGLWGALTGAIDAVWHKLIYPVRLAKMFDWVTERGVIEQIVRFPNCQVKQTARAYKANGVR